jgi:cytochrome o ubiquinol oxidase subunit 2
LGKILFVGKNFQILNPKGTIALQERDLMFTAIFIMLLGVVPVFIFAYYVATHYRSDNTKAKYVPEWDNTKLQVFVWGYLILIMSSLGVLTWTSAHALDPHVAIASTTKPITIEVVALRWKWLFIYPEQNIATINYVEFPQNTPVNFELSASDTPMNSFWIPQLGGQIYAMAGMATQTHLMADGVGQYRGQNAEINGDGYAGMEFTVKSVTSKDFNAWVSTVRQSPKSLDFNTVTQLSNPTEYVAPVYYSSTQENLFAMIVMKYMAAPTNAPSASQTNTQGAVAGMHTMRGMPGM